MPRARSSAASASSSPGVCPLRLGQAHALRPRRGHETLNLYAEAIAKMPENPGIPPLFRDIFKNAYLPYRDPKTLQAVPQDHRRVHLRPQRTARRRLRVSALRARLPGRRRAVPHPAPHHRFHGRNHRPEEDRDRARPGLRHRRVPDLVLQTYPPRTTPTPRGNSTLTPDDKGPPRAELQGLRHLARHGAPVAGEPVPARLRRPAHRRVRHAHQPGPLERIRRRDPRQSALHVAEGRHQTAQPLFGASPSAAKCCSWTTWPSTSRPAAAPASSCPKASSSRARPPTSNCARCWWRNTSSPSSQCRRVCSIPIPASRPQS